VLDLAMTSKDMNLKPMAIGVYSHVSKRRQRRSPAPLTGLERIGKIVADSGRRATFESATSFARLSRTPDRIKVLQDQVKAFADGTKKSARRGRRRAQGGARRGQGAVRRRARALKAAKDKVARAGGERSRTASRRARSIPSCSTSHDGGAGRGRQGRRARTTTPRPTTTSPTEVEELQGVAARVRGAHRAGRDRDPLWRKAECYAGTLTATFDSVKGALSKYIGGIDAMTEDEKNELMAAQIERAMLELGKMGSAAASQTDTLLAAAKSDDRIIRQSIQLALPKIAGKECKQCGAKLDEAIAAGEGKTTLGDLNYETTVLRSFWGDAPAEAAAP
jgi:hypothetical protein